MSTKIKQGRFIQVVGVVLFLGAIECSSKSTIRKEKVALSIVGAIGLSTFLGGSVLVAIEQQKLKEAVE